MTKTIIITIITFVFVIIAMEAMTTTSDVNTIHVNRKDRQLYVLNNNRVIYKSKCGIGKGGLKAKKNMSDLITPTGEFTVDLILYKNPKYNTISQSNIDKYMDSKGYSNMVSLPNGLNRLFQNMNNIDFDKNGRADQAYGTGYIGLSSKNAVSGPKMRMYGKTPYWYSIAIHGTPDEKNIGKANSGGCIHLSEKDLSYLIENGVIKIGTKVIISDIPPKCTKKLHS